MSDVLKEFNKAGLIEKLEGNDERFSKIEAAAKNLAEKLESNHKLLISAAIAAINPDCPVNDPALLMAEDELLKVWTSARSVHVDPPVLIYRSILLEACNQIAVQEKAVILWNTSADTLPLLRLGKEAAIVNQVLSEWARKSEQYSLIIPKSGKIKRATPLKKLEAPDVEKFQVSTVKKETLALRMSDVAGPHDRNSKNGGNPNPHWPNTGHPWSYEFSERLSIVFAEHLDLLYKKIAESDNQVLDKIKESFSKQIEVINDNISNQRSWIQDTLKEQLINTRAEHIRLNTLWWSEALYSSSLELSYRELDLQIASIVMPIDLLSEIETPVSASVSYLAMEAVAKLDDAAHDKKYNILQLLKEIERLKQSISHDWLNEIIVPATTGSITLRDLIFTVLTHSSCDLNDLLKRAMIDANFEITLPKLAQAIFRQEQAVRLANMSLQEED